MPLPDCIEIVPLDRPVLGMIAVPGSKSITNRALILAALAEGESVLRGALWSEDTQVMVDCLQDLGFMINVTPDPAEDSNLTITVYGKSGAVPPGGSPEHPLELFVGNAGTAARFLAAFVCLGRGVYRLDGVPRMRERPQSALFSALRQLGYEVLSDNDRLPAIVHGGGPRKGTCRVSIGESSQFASALLLAARSGQWGVEVEGENAEESPYVTMTQRLIQVFPNGGGSFQIEPDASSGSYFWGAAAFVPSGSNLTVPDWPASGWQIDQAFPEVAKRILTSAEPLAISRQSDLGDSIMTAMILAALARAPMTFTDLGRLRLQECERVTAMKAELTKCGVQVLEQGDSLTVRPGPIRGADIETYNDHRLAMCFSLLGLSTPGIRIKTPACVKKTFPNFFQKLAAAPPRGLGVRILSGDERLRDADLFAG